jgi:uncharacterized membrane protein
VDQLTQSITAASLAMILIGAADAINKGARRQDVPIGSYLIVQTTFYTVIVLLLALLSGGIKWQHADIVFSVLGALFGFAGFTLMLHSLTHGQASVNYAIFRSSFVLSTAAAVLLLNERLFMSKIIGVTLACLAIFLFFYEPKRQTVICRSLFIALIAMFVAAGFHLVVKLSTRVFSSPLSFILLMNIFFGIFVLLYNFLFGYFKFPKATFIFAPMNGSLMGLGTFFYVTALQEGELSTVMPIMQLSFIITAILTVFLLKEEINMHKILAILCAAIAIIVLGMFRNH